MRLVCRQPPSDSQLAWMNWPGEDEPCFPDEALQRVDISVRQSPEAPNPPLTTAAEEARTRSKLVGLRDPGNAALIAGLAPNDPDFLRPHLDDCSVESPSDCSPTVTDHMETATEDSARVDGEQQATSLGASRESDERHDSVNTGLDGSVKPDANALALAANAAIASGESNAQVEPKGLASRRAPPAHDTISQLSPHHRPSRTVVRSPLKLHTTSSDPAMQPPPPPAADTIAASPTLAKHVISAPHNTLPAVQPTSPAQDRDAGSPNRLPSFRQLTGQLNELADAAAQEPRPYSHNHSQSFGSTTSQSPRLPYHPPGYSGSAHTSPAGPSYGYIARSPTGASTTSDIHQVQYGSPPQYPTPTAYFIHRRSSAATDNGQFPASLPSASTTSSGESHGHPGSSTDGYSTAHTTPVDQPPTADSTPRPILPPVPGMSQSAMVMSSFKCDYSGCTAAPFQTQYLLRYVPKSPTEPSTTHLPIITYPNIVFQSCVIP